MGVASGDTRAGLLFLIVLVQACIAGRRSTAKGASACIVASEASACNQHMHAGCGSGYFGNGCCCPENWWRNKNLGR